MGSALAGGLVSSGWAPPPELQIVERLEPLRRRLAKDHPGLVVSERARDVRDALLAVKPVDAEAACRELARSGVSRLLSVVAGVSSETLSGWLPARTVVLRAMSNTPALLGDGASAVAPGPSAEAGDLSWAEGVLRSVGEVVTVPEELLDAVTGLSGSGPAYVFLLAEALEEAGVAQGLSRETSRRLAAVTIRGSGRMLAETGEEPAELRRAVTSPRGTTEAGLRALRARGFAGAVTDAVAAAAERSRQLGSSSPSS